jgi:hypothetical protein
VQIWFGWLLMPLLDFEIGFATQMFCKLPVLHAMWHAFWHKHLTYVTAPKSATASIASVSRSISHATTPFASRSASRASLADEAAAADATRGPPPSPMYSRVTSEAALTHTHDESGQGAAQAPDQGAAHTRPNLGV